MHHKLLIAVAAAMYVLAMWIFLGWVFWKAWAQWWRNRRSPLIRIPAIVTDKEQEVKYFTEFNSAEVTRRFVTFDCKDGVEREFEVPERLFDSMAQGDHGTLHFRGEKFVAFDGARYASNLDDVYKRVVRG